MSASAESNDIKQAYYTLAKKHHPDASGGSGNKELFKSITEAYAILSDQKLRKNYDTLIFGDSASGKKFEN